MDRGTQRLERVNKVLKAYDLVTVVNYNEAGRTTVSGVEYSSADIGFTVHETFASGTQILTITRSLV